MNSDDLATISASEHCIFIKSAKGKVPCEKLSIPVTVVDPETSKDHTYQIVCPWNLQGRDLMCQLGIAIIPTDRGLRAQRPGEVHMFRGAVI